jgi:hypothetical protein
MNLYEFWKISWISWKFKWINIFEKSYEQCLDPIRTKAVRH